MRGNSFIHSFILNELSLIEIWISIKTNSETVIKWSENESFWCSSPFFGLLRDERNRIVAIFVGSVVCLVLICSWFIVNNFLTLIWWPITACPAAVSLCVRIHALVTTTYKLDCTICTFRLALNWLSVSRTSCARPCPSHLVILFGVYWAECWFKSFRPLLNKSAIILVIQKLNKSWKSKQSWTLSFRFLPSKRLSATFAYSNAFNDLFHSS